MFYGLVPSHLAALSEQRFLFRWFVFQMPPTLGTVTHAAGPRLVFQHDVFCRRTMLTSIQADHLRKCCSEFS